VRTYLKAITTIDKDASNLIVSTGFVVISPNKKIESKYTAYLAISEWFVNTICSASTGVSYPTTNASTIGDLHFILPPLSEQTAIATYLDEKTTHIDRIITNIRAQIEQLQALRKVLINEVVTGKIKVCA
jgi:type I restriction enzyme S subunit